MKYSVIETSRSLLRLIRFLFWYALGVAAVFKVLPTVAVYLQGQYDALIPVARYSLLAALTVLTVAWLAARRFRKAVALAKLAQ
jgi:hypothetical protein